MATRQSGNSTKWQHDKMENDKMTTRQAYGKTTKF